MWSLCERNRPLLRSFLRSAGVNDVWQLSPWHSPRALVVSTSAPSRRQWMPRTQSVAVNVQPLRAILWSSFPLKMTTRCTALVSRAYIWRRDGEGLHDNLDPLLDLYATPCETIRLLYGMCSRLYVDACRLNLQRYGSNSTWLDTFDFVETSETSRALPTWGTTNDLVQV